MARPCGSCGRRTIAIMAESAYGIPMTPRTHGRAMSAAEVELEKAKANAAVKAAALAAARAAINAELADRVNDSNGFVDTCVRTSPLHVPNARLAGPLPSRTHGETACEWPFTGSAHRHSSSSVLTLRLSRSFRLNSGKLKRPGSKRARKRARIM